MLDAGLAATAALMGLAGTPHCLAMCGAPCTAAGAGAPLLFQIGRLSGYAAAGAVTAASVQVLGQLGEASALLRPLWVLVHVAALLLGLALLWRGTQPAWLTSVGQQLRVPVPALGGGRVAFAKPARAGLLGLAWVGWPCGLLQSALLVAALASGPVQGGAVMASFALTSGAGLALGPWLLSRMRSGPGNRATGGAGGLRLSVRLAGFGLAAASGWALTHGLWAQFVAFCSQAA